MLNVLVNDQQMNKGIFLKKSSKQLMIRREECFSFMAMVALERLLCGKLYQLP
jgi:hypothetical protein